MTLRAMHSQRTEGENLNEGPIMHYSLAVPIRATAVLALASMTIPAISAPVVNGAFQQLDNRTSNSVGIPVGLYQHVGATSAVDDNGQSATLVGQATQAGLTRDLIYQPATTAPNFFSRVFPVNTGRLGSWDLTFTDTNTGASTMVSTPDLSGAQVMPFPTSVAISGSGNAPTFTWALPANAPIDGMRINIWTPDRIINTDGQADQIFSTSTNGPTTSFTVNPTQLSLVAGTRYSLEIGLLDLRDPTAAATNVNILSRSRSFFDFTLLSGNVAAQVYLPTVANIGGQPVYQFGIDVTANQLVFIDPVVATGYEYRIGQGDPMFTRALLPTGIGDDLYDILLWDGVSWIPFMTAVAGGTEIDFGQGVDRFQVVGIEPSAGLDPEDVTAFMTGLRFAADGRFTGTMTPIILQVGEPGSLALGLLGLASLFGASKRSVGMVRRRTPSGLFS